MSLPSACVIAAAAAASLAAALASASPRTGTVAALFPPWWSAAQAAEAAAGSGDILGFGALRSLVVVRGDAADLAMRLRRAGALVILDGRAVALCGTAPAGAQP